MITKLFLQPYFVLKKFYRRGHNTRNRLFKREKIKIKIYIAILSGDRVESS